jgi:hypothetical protein
MAIVIQDVTPRIQYTVGGPPSLNFAFTWAMFSPTDIEVYLTPPNTAPNDVAQIQTYNIDYTVAINAPPAVGGTVTFLAQPAQNSIVTLARAQPDNRLDNYINGGLFEATQVNTDFDRTVLMAQQNTMYDQTIGVHYNVSGVVDPVVDNVLPVLPANCAWVKNQDNTAIVALNVGNGINPFTVALPTTDDAIAIYDGVNGSLQNSGVVITGGTVVTGATSITSGDVTISGSNIQSTVGTLTLHGAGGGGVAIQNGQALGLFEATNTYFTGLEAGAIGASYIYTLPAADGQNGYVMTTNGAGQLSFQPARNAQIVMATSNVATNTVATIPYGAGIPQNTDGTALMNVTITPNLAASTLCIEFYCPIVSVSSGATVALFALYRDATANALTVTGVQNDANTRGLPVFLRFYVAANAAVATTFYIRYGTQSGGGGATTYVLQEASGGTTFGGIPQMNLTVTEIQ